MIYEIQSNSFELKDVFECGQCFRWNKKNDCSYIGVFDNIVLKVKKIDNKIVFEGSIYDANNDNKNERKEFEKKINHYFDINTDYEKIKQQLSQIDEYLKNSIEYGSGIRILNQDLWETIISFIISANNNIPRIKGIIERISKNYGKRIIFQNEEYYMFPTPEELSQASVEDLRKLGLGFRDKRVYQTTQLIVNNQFDLKQLYELDTEKAKEKLLTLPGVGPKVADCILLFSDLKRLDVFPIDVWVRRVMNELYIHNSNEEKVNKKEIIKIANEKFGNLQGIAQQYLFYWKREA